MRQTRKRRVKLAPARYSRRTHVSDNSIGQLIIVTGSMFLTLYQVPIPITNLLFTILHYIEENGAFIYRKDNLDANISC